MRPGTLALCLVALIVASFLLGVWAATPSLPYCPQEDSCRADYHGDTHTWTIEEVAP